MIVKSTLCSVALAIGLMSAPIWAASVAYIHGDVSECGSTPAASESMDGCDDTPFDQMLIDDTGDRGLSQFAQMVRGEGHTIEQFYDQNTSLNAAFLDNIDVIVFGLHQKLWSAQEREALFAWLEQGGGMLIYSDSASGGSFQRVGAQNPIGQMVTNNLLAPTGIQVTVDQANGTRAVEASDAVLPIDLRGLTLEGEGVSPVAIAEGDTTTQVLVPFDCNGCSANQTQGLDLPRSFASLVLRPVGQGNISVLFDRQPLWNRGSGSNINEQNNKEILRRLINFLALTVIDDPDPDPPSGPNPGSELPATSLPAVIQLLVDDQ